MNVLVRTIARPSQVMEVAVKDLQVELDDGKQAVVCGSFYVTACEIPAAHAAAITVAKANLEAAKRELKDALNAAWKQGHRTQALTPESLIAQGAKDRINTRRLAVHTSQHHGLRDVPWGAKPAADDPSFFGYGHTEEEAIADLCLREGFSPRRGPVVCTIQARYDDTECGWKALSRPEQITVIPKLYDQG